MLSIGKINGADGRSGRYYTDAVASGAEDYYAGRGEAQGRWIGTGAELFELDGPVDAEQFHRLLNGIDPATGRVLRAAPRDPASGELREGVVRAFDLTFSAPKSVSVLYAAGDDRVAGEVRAALDQATGEALRWLEQRACVVRRGAGGAVELPGAGFIAAAFRHRTSRAGDPQLHTHVVVANMARGGDGRWTALRGAYVYEHSRTAGFVFQAVMRDELSRRLGVRWRESPTPGVYEIAGVPFELMRELSKRRIGIERAIEEHGVTSAAGAQTAALATRPAKDHQLDQAPHLHEAWRALTSERGFGREEVAAITGPGRDLALTEEMVAAISAQLVGPEGLTERESTFGEQDVVRALAQALPAGISLARLDELTAAFLARPDVVELPVRGSLDVHAEPGTQLTLEFDAHGGREGEESGAATRAGTDARRRWTTRSLLTVERALLDRAQAGRDAGAGVCGEQTVARVLDDAVSASDEQRAMVRTLTRSGDRVHVVRAPAGAGKTWTLDLARQAWQQAGHPVIGVALSRRAASELRDQAHLDYATSITRLQLDIERDGGLPAGCVLIVDEAAMVGTRDLHHLLDHVEQAGGALVLVGDDHQLPAIHAAGAFRALAERLDVIELHDNFRQQDPLEQVRARALRHGATDAWLQTGLRTGRIVLGPDAQRTRELLVADWLHDRQLVPVGEAIMLARTNTDVTWLNDAARRALTQAGELPGPELSVAGRSFAIGDLVVARRNLPGGELDNGTRAVVVALDAERQAVTVRTLVDERSVTLGAGYLHERHLHHGYALTAHLAQGMSADRLRILGGEGHDREWAYSAGTRHRISAHFYLTAPEPHRLAIPDRDPLEQITRTLGRSTAKSLALDTTPPAPALQATSSDELRSRRDVLRELLATYPAKAIEQHDWHTRQLTEARQRLADIRARVDQLEARLDAADRDQRPEVEFALRREQSTAQAWEREAAEHTNALAALPSREQPGGWLERHAPAIRELAHVEHELDRRDAHELLVAALVAPDPAIEAPRRTLRHDGPELEL